MTEERILTPKDFEDRGYRSFVDSMHTGRFCAGNWSRRIDDRVGTRYSIRIRAYDFPEQPLRFVAHVQFHENYRFEGPTFNVERNVSAGIVEMETFFERMWTKMGLNYHESFFDPERNA